MYKWLAIVVVLCGCHFFEDELVPVREDCSPSGLMGKSVDSLIYCYGQPAHKEVDGSREVWRYDPTLQQYCKFEIESQTVIDVSADDCSQGSNLLPACWVNQERLASRKEVVEAWGSPCDMKQQGQTPPYFEYYYCAECDGFGACAPTACGAGCTVYRFAFIGETPVSCKPLNVD